MSAIGKGSMLVCIRSTPSRSVIAGRTYECSGLDEHSRCPDCGDNTQGIFLVEAAAAWPFVAFCHCRFVPAGRKGQFDSLLKCEPTKQEARETADALTTMFTPQDWAKKMGGHR